MLASVGLAKEEPVPAAGSSIPPQSNPMETGPVPSTWLAGIPEEAKVVSVKGSIKSGVTSRVHGEDMKAS